MKPRPTDPATTRIGASRRRLMRRNLSQREVDDDGRMIGEGASVGGGQRAFHGRGDRRDVAAGEPVESRGNAAVPGAKQADQEARQQAADQLLRAVEYVGIREVV